MPTTHPFRVSVRGQSIDMTVEHAASFGLTHLGSAMGLPRLDWAPADSMVIGTPTGLAHEVACAKWAQALAGNPTRIVAVAGRHTIVVTGA